ncbi:DUF2127 domain-containing protein [Acidobacteria bacterium AB60]|nr:DUF2127 domain-containing protein [Acidobacteria bacterium AB60]
MKTHSKGLLRLIAVFKLLKAATLIATGIGILKFVHRDLGEAVEHWIRMLGLNPGSRHLDHLIQSVTNLPPTRIKELGIGSFIYAGLFLTEGIGLWLLKRWAEWFTIIITSSLVPLEIYEIYRHPTIIKAAVLVINIAVVVYLVYRVRSESDAPAGRALLQPSTPLRSR